MRRAQFSQFIAKGCLSRFKTEFDAACSTTDHSPFGISDSGYQLTPANSDFCSYGNAYDQMRIHDFEMDTSHWSNTAQVAAYQVPSGDRIVLPGMYASIIGTQASFLSYG